MNSGTSKHITLAHVQALQQVAVQLIESTDDHELLNFIVQRAMDLLKCDGGSLYLRHDANNLIFAVAVNRTVSFHFESVLIPIFANGIAAYSYKTGETVKVADVYELSPECPYHFDTGFDSKIGYRTQSVLAIPLTSSKGEKLGVLQLINRKEKSDDKWISIPQEMKSNMPTFSDEDVELLKAFAALASAAIEKAKLYENIEKLFEGFIRASVRVIEERDPGTRGHSERVATLTVELARRVTQSTDRDIANIRFNHKQLQELHYSALLHDFGKVGVSEKLLLKQDKLFTEELLRIRSRLDHFSYAAESRVLWDAIKEMASKKVPPTQKDINELQGLIRNHNCEIEKYWDIIRESNRPTVLEARISSELHKIREKQLPVSDGGMRRVLEPNEFMSLSISRGSLSDDERRLIEHHVTGTYLFLKEIPWTQDYAQVPEVAYCHHEKLDSSGYPRKLAAEQIPLQSRMMAICDIYDALVASDRPYKKSLTMEAALEILDDEAKRGKLDLRFLRVFKEAKVYVNSEFLSLNPFKKAA